MAEQVLEDKKCLECGENHRPGALFCYNCGSEVKEELNGNEKLPNDEYKTGPLKNLEAIEKPVGIPLETAKPSKEEKINNREKRVAVERETNLKTAASLRKRKKPEEKKQVEVVWDVPERSSHTWFVLVSLILVLFALIMLMAMLYWR